MYKMNSVLAAALLAAPIVNGHYIFSQLVVNDEMVGQDYTYIRKNTNTYMPSFTDDVVNSPNLICNENANTASSQTYDVKAGDKIGFKLAYDEFIEHPGPGFVYMSKAPSDVSSYTGDGDWFKAYEIGLNGDASEDTNWGSWQKDRLEFTIPADTPDGEYLVRPEHIAIHEAHVGKAQFYMECAQLRVSGGGSGNPSPLVQIPGLYSAQDPGIAFNKWSGDTSNYEMPGPAVWSGGGSGGASSASSTVTESDASSDASTGSSSAPAASSSAPAAGSSGQGSSDSSAQTGGQTGAQNGGQAGGQAGGAPAWGNWGGWGGNNGGGAPNTNSNSAWGQWNGASAGGNSWGGWNSRVKGRSSA